MLKKFLFIALFLPLLSIAEPSDSTKTTPAEHGHWRSFVGVQANLLIRNVLNFGGSTTSLNDNPYLLSCSVYNDKCGWGAAVGLGINTTHTSTSDASESTQKTDAQTVSVRLGAEKRCRLLKHWSAAYGFDLLVDNSVSSSVNKTVQAFESDETDTDNKNNSYGGGIRGSLYYAISPRIWIGSETSLTYLTGKMSSSVTEKVTTQFGGGSSTSNTTNSSGTISGFTMNLPTALFILVKF